MLTLYGFIAKFNFIFVVNKIVKSMLGTFLKKKLSDNQLANVFINGILDVVDNGFGEVVALINEDLAFVESPNLTTEQNGQFTMIVLVANISSLENTFETVQASRIETLIFDKIGQMMGVNATEAEQKVREYQRFMNRINHPSKNMIYAMSRAIFFKYNLNDFQDEYFRRLQAPNPLFLKRMDQVVVNFLWDWDSFFKKYKIDE